MCTGRAFEVDEEGKGYVLLNVDEEGKGWVLSTVDEEGGGIVNRGRRGRC